MLSEVLQLLHIALTIPVTSATAERTFSLHRLKNFLQLSTTQTRLNQVMVLHVHKGKIDCIDLDDIAKGFNERIILVLYSSLFFACVYILS